MTDVQHAQEETVLNQVRALKTGSSKALRKGMPELRGTMFTRHKGQTMPTVLGQSLTLDRTVPIGSKALYCLDLAAVLE